MRSEPHQGRAQSHQAKNPSDGIATPTVASLGMQVRLVPVDAEQERRLADLAVACKVLRAEWERLRRLEARLRTRRVARCRAAQRHLRHHRPEGGRP